MPPELGPKEALLSVGTAAVIGMFYFYRRKHTVGFKVCYGLMWPTLGGGVMLAVQPSEQEMAQKLERAGMLDQGALSTRREANRETIEAMKRLAVAGGGGSGGGGAR